MKNFRIVTGYIMKTGVDVNGDIIENNGEDNLIRPDDLEQVVKDFIQWCEERNYKIAYINFHEIKDVIFDK